MDPNTRNMLLDAYLETVQEAVDAGRDSDTAHKEGITAAAMFHASMAGVDDATARAEVEAENFSPALLEAS